MRTCLLKPVILIDTMAEGQVNTLSRTRGLCATRRGHDHRGMKDLLVINVKAQGHIYTASVVWLGSTALKHTSSEGHGTLL